MILSNRHAFLYVGIPKTATHSVTALLKQRYGGMDVGRYHGSSWEVPGVCLAWTVVRNPWARLASWWRARVRDQTKMNLPELTPPWGTFAEFLEWMVINRDGADLDQKQGDQRQPQHVFYSRQPCTRFVRYEHFDEDFALLPFAGIVNEGILSKRRNASDVTAKPLSEWYDDKAVEMAIHYGVLAECQAFGYPEDLP